MFRSPVFAIRRAGFSTLPTKKYKCPKKKASSLLNELKLEEFSKLKNGRNWERVLAGDSVEIQRLPYTTSTTPEILRGIVLGKVNRQSDTSLTMINVEHGTPVLRRIVMYNPLIQSVKVLQTAFIHEGKKRVRRSKIYYLQNRDPEFFTVPQ